MSDVLSHFGHPPVLVISSPALDLVMQKNFLSFAELLKPFGHPPLLTQAMNFRTPMRGPYQLVRWGVRFVSVVEMEEMEAKMGERFLELALQMQTMDGSKLRQIDQITANPADVAKFNNMNPDPNPWYTRYRTEMINSLRFKPAELVDQPLACMIAVLATEANPQQFIESTRNPAKLPSGLQRGVYDVNMVRSIVVVHDKHTERADPHARHKAIELVKSLARIYGSDVLPALCEINGFPIDTPNPSQRDLWSSEVLQGRAMSRYGGGNARGSEPPPFTGEVRESGMDLDEGAESFQSLPLHLVDITAQPADESWKSDTNFVVGLPAHGDAFHGFLVQSLSTPPQTARGQFLTPVDIDYLATFVHTFITKSLIPGIEHRWLSLHEKVSAVRGSLNRLRAGWKSMIGGARPSSFGFVPQLGTYHLQSPESQARQLADLSYVMQDFETASECYSYVIRDYRTDVRTVYCWHHLASANEMQALTLAHLEPNRYADAIREHFDSARSIYMSIGDQRRAVRVAILAAESYRIRAPTVERWKEGIAMTLRAARREFTPNPHTRTIRSALMIEHAAYTYLLAPQPLQPFVRKYALALVLSARLYRCFGLKALEARADSCAAHFYAGKSWFAINQSINDRLGKEQFQLNRFAAAVNSYVQLIGKPHNIDLLTGKPINPLLVNQSVIEQHRALNDLVWLVNQWHRRTGTNKQVPGLELPAFVNQSIKVHCSNQQILLNQSISSSSINQTIEPQFTTGAWNAASRIGRMTLDPSSNNKHLFNLEQTLTPSTPLPPNMYRDAERGAIIRERITIEIQTTNHLTVPLSLANVRLQAKLSIKPPANSASPPPTSKSPTEIILTNGFLSNSPLPSSISQSEATAQFADAPFAVYCQSLTVEGSQKRSIALSLIPLVEGVLTVEGVCWEVVFDQNNQSSRLNGFHAFELPPRVTGRAKGQPIMSPDHSLTIPINPPAPNLSVDLENFPAHCLYGEIIRSSITLTNKGELPLCNVVVRVSHPGFVLFGKASQSNNHAIDQSAGEMYGYNWNDVLVELGLTLEPNRSVTLPLYMRAAVGGRHDIQLMFRYEPSVNQSNNQSVSQSTKPRIVYMKMPLFVAPCMSVKPSAKPSFASVTDSLLAVDLFDRQMPASYQSINQSNKQSISQSNIVIESVSCSSKTWTIAPIGQSPSANQFDNQSASQSNDQSVNQSINQSVDCSTALTNGGSLSLMFRIAALPALLRDSPISQSEAEAHISTVSFNHSDNQSVNQSINQSIIQCLLAQEKSILIEQERQSLLVNPGAVIADVGAANRLDLIVTYSINQSTNQSVSRSKQSINRYGSLHLPGLTTMRVPPTACPIKVSVDFPSQIIVDQSIDQSTNHYNNPPPSTVPLASLPITLSVRNLCEDATLSLSFECLPVEEEFDVQSRSFSAVQSSHLTGRFMWRGCTRVRINQFHRHEIAKIQLNADITQWGSFNINRFRFTLDTGVGKKPRVFFFPIQNIVHVKPRYLNQSINQSHHFVDVVEQTIDQTINQSHNQSVDQDHNQTTEQANDLAAGRAFFEQELSEDLTENSMNQYVVNQSVNQPIDQSVDQPIDSEDYADQSNQHDWNQSNNDQSIDQSHTDNSSYDNSYQFNQSHDQSVNQSINQSEHQGDAFDDPFADDLNNQFDPNQPINLFAQPTHQSHDDHYNQSINQSTDQSVNQSNDELESTHYDSPYEPVIEQQSVKISLADSYNPYNQPVNQSINDDNELDEFDEYSTSSFTDQPERVASTDEMIDSQSINQSINQSYGQSINQSVNTNPAYDQADNGVDEFDDVFDPKIDQSVNQSVDNVSHENGVNHDEQDAFDTDY